MEFIVKVVLKKFLWLVFIILGLTSCIKNESQILIFRRYNSSTNNWDYYKTDINKPSLVEEINIIPCPEFRDYQHQPVWSPNGKYYGCAGVGDHSFFIYDTVDNAITTILDQENPKDTFGRYIQGWSPDSQYVSILSNVSKEKPYYDLSIMKYDGSEMKLINKADNEINTTAFLGGQWSPNGEYIVTQVRPRSDDHNYLIVSSPSGKEIFRFDLVNFIHAPTGFVNQLEWSPDSKKLALSIYLDSTSNPRLFVLDIENGELLDIVSDKSICIMSVPDWSPDGKKILFGVIGCKEHISLDNHDSVYYSIKADGTGLKQLTDKGSGSLHWTLDGKSIIISGYGSENIYIIDIDGNNRRKLLENGYFVSWVKP